MPKFKVTVSWCSYVDFEVDAPSEDELDDIIWDEVPYGDAEFYDHQITAVERIPSPLEQLAEQADA